MRRLRRASLLAGDEDFLLMILTAQREGDAQHEPEPTAALPAAPQMGKL